MTEFKYDLHVHTAETSRCATVTGREMVRLYKEAGYTGVVITDHYFKTVFDSYGVNSWTEKIDMFLAGFRSAKAESDKIGLTVFLGMEISFTENRNDFLVYGFDESFLYNNEELYLLGVAGFSRLAASKDMLIYQAHPFRNGTVTPNFEDIHGIEVFNGSIRYSSNNDKAMQYAEDHNLLKISGSDFHFASDAARGGIILNNAVSCSKELVECLRESNSYRLITSL